MAYIEDRRGERQGKGWRVRYRGPNGRERSQSFARRAEAVKFMHSNEVSKDAGLWVDPTRGKLRFEDWSARWMESRTFKPNTRAGYESLLRNHLSPTFGGVPLARIEPGDIQQWVTDLQRVLSSSRVRQSYFLLSGIMRAAVRDSYLARTPCIGIVLPKPRSAEMNCLDAEGVRDLAEAARPPYGTLIYFLAYGGARWGESAALRKGRCELLRGQVWIRESLSDVDGTLYFVRTKTEKDRAIGLPSFLRDLLAEHLTSVEGEDALVFTSPEGAPLRLPNWRRSVWYPALESAGLPRAVRVHDLRHTCASLLIAQGAHPKAIQEHLGHSSIQVTLDRYGHLFDDVRERMAEGLDATYRESLAAPPRPKVTELRSAKVEQAS
jgi:integrase